MKLYRIQTTSGPTLVHESDGELYSFAAPVTIEKLHANTKSTEVLGGYYGKLSEAKLLAPVQPGKIIAVGLNYRDHIRECGMEEPKRPLLFAKFPSSITGPTDPIVFDPQTTSRVDWEAELAVVIGKRMRNVSRADAMDYVFGYTVANDVSARDVQFADGQWTRGKSFDTFCPIGPVLLTRDEVKNPQHLSLKTLINGEVVQNSSTAEMLFQIDEILSFCSSSFTLEPGDLVLTGTPWGCGEFMNPKRSMHHGDLVEVEVESIGRLSNRVVEATAA